MSQARRIISASIAPEATRSNDTDRTAVAVRGNDAASVNCVEEKEMAYVVVTGSSSKETDRYVTATLGKF